MVYKGKKILAVVPARGGSKGIPNKNLKLLNSKPLIQYILETLNSVEEIDKIVVTSDSQEILDYCSKFADIIKRPESLAKDVVTLDPVIFHAYKISSEKEDFDYIFTFQPTSPLLTKETIKKGLVDFIDGEYDSLITVIDDRHLTWKKDYTGKYIPIYEKRLNRQQLPPKFKETGGILACSRNVISPETRLGENIFLLEISFEESIDIDNYYDFIFVNALLKNPKLAFIVTGNVETGLGHVYRTLLLANRFNFKPIFLVNSKDKIALEKINEHHYSVYEFTKTSDLIKILKEHKIDLIINDILDTSKEYMSELNKLDAFITNFEDLGDGSDMSHLVINSLYESKNTEHKFFGHHYVCLREEFLFSEKKKIEKNVKNILVTFGGTDPNNITCYVLENLKKYKNLNIDVVLGPGYSHMAELESLITCIKNVNIHKNVRKMSAFMLKADIIITSNGRTTYETASLGVPTISISQNQREIKHLFGEITQTTVNLGLFADLDENLFNVEFDNLLNDFERRNELNKNMLKINLVKGTDRVINLILGKYYEFKGENKSEN